jgi:hypothetical protein
MKTMKLSMTALALVVLSQAAGCIFVSDDEDEIDQGVFHSTWTLTQGGSAVTCGDVGAVSVSVLSTGSDNMGHDDLFDCVDMAGDTFPLALDDYTIAVDILDAAMASLAVQPAVLDASFLTDPCDRESGSTCIIDLPNVEFAFSP